MGIDKLITGVVILGLFNILNYKLYFILTIQVGVLIIIWLVRLNAIIVYIIKHLSSSSDSLTLAAIERSLIETIKFEALLTSDTSSHSCLPLVTLVVKICLLQHGDGALIAVGFDVRRVEGMGESSDTQGLALLKSAKSHLVSNRKHPTTLRT